MLHKSSSFISLKWSVWSIVKLQWSLLSGKTFYRRLPRGVQRLLAVKWGLGEFRVGWILFFSFFCFFLFWLFLIQDMVFYSNSLNVVYSKAHKHWTGWSRAKPHPPFWGRESRLLYLSVSVSHAVVTWLKDCCCHKGPAELLLLCIRAPVCLHYKLSELKCKIREKSQHSDVCLAVNRTSLLLFMSY